MKNYINIGDVMIIGGQNIEIMRDDADSKKLLEEENNLEKIQKNIVDVTRSLKWYSEDKKDSIFCKTILTSIIFSSVLLIDSIICATALLNPVMYGAVKFMLETSLIGLGISGVLATIIHFDKRKLVRKITEYKIELGRLSKEEAQIKEKIKSLQKPIHIANNEMSTQYNCDDIKKNIELEVAYLMEQEEQYKQKTLGSKKLF